MEITSPIHSDTSIKSEMENKSIMPENGISPEKHYEVDDLGNFLYDGDCVIDDTPVDINIL